MSGISLEPLGCPKPQKVAILEAASLGIPDGSRPGRGAAAAGAAVPPLAEAEMAWRRESGVPSGWMHQLAPHEHGPLVEHVTMARVGWQEA